MDTFCVLPWYSKEIKKIPTVCCWLPRFHDLPQIKQDLLAGVQSPACSACWELEKNGQRSRRQIENAFLDYKLDQDLDKIRQDCVDNKNQTLLYQITVSNLCNQACVSCNGAASSKWIDLEKKLGITSNQKFEINLDDLAIDYAHARRIEFVGGEPFYDAKTFKILENLSAHGNHDCFISIVTNGSVKLRPEQLNLLKRFTDVSVCVSIDGIGPVFEYLRWPGRWSTLLENLEQYRSIFDISVSYTISGLNAVYYQQTVDWFDSQGLPYNHNLVTYPAWLALEHAPIEIKNHFPNTGFISNWKNFNGTELSMEKFREQIQNQDRVKHTSIRDYLPELADIIFDNQ